MIRMLKASGGRRDIGSLAGCWVAFVILGVFSISCQEQSETPQKVRLSHGPEVDVRSLAREEQRPIRLVFASVTSPERSAVGYARFANYLSVYFDRPVEIVRRKSYAELNELLRNGNADAGIVCTGAYATGREDFGLRMLMVPVIDEKTTYKAYIIARRSTHFMSLEDLEGLVFAFSDPMSNTGYRYVAASLWDRGLTPDQFFKRYFFTYSHDGTIQAVRDGIADAGTVDSLVWDELVQKDQRAFEELEVVERSEAFPINPFVVSPKADEAMVRGFEKALDEMSLDPEGITVLEGLGISRFTTIEDEHYDVIVESWRNLGVIKSATRAESP